MKHSRIKLKSQRISLQHVYLPVWTQIFFLWKRQEIEKCHYSPNRLLTQPNNPKSTSINNLRMRLNQLSYKLLIKCQRQQISLDVATLKPVSCSKWELKKVIIIKPRTQKADMNDTPSTASFQILPPPQQCRSPLLAPVSKSHNNKQPV